MIDHAIKLYVRRGDRMNLKLVELGPDEDVPGDEFCYVLGANGLHERLSNDVYEGIVPSSNCPQLSRQPRVVRSRLPRVSAETVELIVGFFKQVWREFRSEAIVLLYYSPNEETYMILVPHQEVDVWEKDNYGWFHVDLKYETPNTPCELLQRGYRLVGSVHSHGSFWAGHSSVDNKDEAHRNGLHITIGRVNHEEPEFSCSFMVQKTRQILKTDDVIDGYEKPRQPRTHWIKRVKKGPSRWAQTWGLSKKDRDDEEDKGGNGEYSNSGYSNSGYSNSGYSNSGGNGSGGGGNGFGKGPDKVKDEPQGDEKVRADEQDANEGEAHPAKEKAEA